ncbi:MAG TPA: ABC transporter substrate-binding protein, partial [Pseudonocardiaceae bacterium]|nr:ABC transporter substrate-binding protein [Pseudonocardiaceae bacterium]
MVAVIILVFVVLQPWRTTRVTDGSEVFADYLGHVERLILAENKSVDNSGQAFVSIAYMMPIRREENDPVTDVAVLYQLQGAYLAQYWSNHPDGRPTFGSSRPLIKLLLADSGPLGTAWKSAVDQLRHQAGREHLVAVAGLGFSLTTTQEAIATLDSSEITMVASVLTSSGITARNLWRVAPTNSDESAAALKYIEKTPEWKSATREKPYTAYLVQDKAARESYSADLGEAYRELFPVDGTHRLLSAQGEFDSSKPAAGNALDAQVNMICAIRPQAVLFAGRSRELELLIRSLAGRWCAQDVPVTIVTGDDATLLNAPNGSNRNLLWQDRENIKVFYSTLATPLAWEKDPNFASESVSKKFGSCPQCFRELFGDTLNDGQAIMSYDAVVTVVKAARGVASPDNNFEPSVAALPNGFYKINSTNPAPGASGLICYQGEVGKSGHVPFNKAVPIIQLNPDGQRMLVDLSSRLGTPPSQTCPPS